MVAECLFSVVRVKLGSSAFIDKESINNGCRLVRAVRKVYTLEDLCSIPTTTTTNTESVWLGDG